MRRDPSLDALLDLHGQVLVLDGEGRFWVRFICRRVPATPERPHGLDYSLTLHGMGGERLVGFDNAHTVRAPAGPGGRGGTARDHRHRLATVRPYGYRDAATLLEVLGGGGFGVEGKGYQAMTTLKIGIASAADMKARTLAIARGDLKPAADEPKVWFTSTESFAKVLSDKNRRLLTHIAEHHPESLQVLAEQTGRKTSNLSRTLRTMEHYGFVNLHKGARGRIRPEVPYQAISLTLPFAPAS